MYNEKSKVEKYEEVIHRRNNKYITSASIWMTGVWAKQDKVTTNSICAGKYKINEDKSYSIRKERNTIEMQIQWDESRKAENRNGKKAEKQAGCSEVEGNPTYVDKF